jgi:hypothetical protein
VTTKGSVPVRRAMLTLLKADADLTAMVPTASIQPPASSPSRPFIRYGAPFGTPITAACVDGDTIRGSVHSWASVLKDGAGNIIESAEDFTDRIGTRVMQVIHRQRLDLGGGIFGKVKRTGFQLMQDGAEADLWHHVANFEVRVLS